MSKIKVNEIENRTGSTLTLGKSGTTIQLACGATQTGFGRTGTVDWCTTAKTSPFTSVSGKGYFINTTSGAVTITLPSSPSGGDIVSIKDYAGTFGQACKAVTIGRGGSKIGGLCLDATVDTAGDSITLIYVDGTQGWLNVQTDDTIQGQSFVAATGGTVTTCGDFKIHTFTSSGCFAVSNAGTPTGSNSVSYLVIGGGGSAGGWAPGGGGAGGFREGKAVNNGNPDSYTASPLAAASGVPVLAQTYPITVGAGGAGQPYPARNSTTKGSNSIFATITSAGGGVGAPNDAYPGHDSGATVGNGGSGGGSTASPTTVGQGNTPPVSPPQGNNGGQGGTGGGAGYFGGGGGGAGAVGSNAGPPNDAGPGGAGLASSINGTPTLRAGGGGGGNVATGSSTGGPGGGGGSTPSGSSSGTANTGGGGGGSYAPTPTGTSAGAGGSGGSGVVIIRYKFQ